MPEYRTCGKCEYYSHALSRCRLGKVNPRQLNQTISAMRWGGVTYICPWSKWRAKAADRLVKEGQDANTAQ